MVSIDSVRAAGVKVLIYWQVLPVSVIYAWKSHQAPKTLLPLGLNPESVAERPHLSAKEPPCMASPAGLGITRSGDTEGAGRGNGFTL